jgi:hypothetical protein
VTVLPVTIKRWSVDVPGYNPPFYEAPHIIDLSRDWADPPVSESVIVITVGNAHDPHRVRKEGLPFNFVDRFGSAIIDRRSFGENYEVVDGLPRFVVCM